MAQARKKTDLHDALRLDPSLLLTATTLALFGLVMVASASIAIAVEAGQGPLYYMWRHLVFLTAGVVGSIVVLHIPLSFLQKHSVWALPIAFFLLALVFIPGFGVTRNGATRWINLGLSNFQVSEAAKLALIVYFAGYLVRRREQVVSLLGSIKPLIVAGLAAGLLFLQPDFGTAALLLLMAATMIWLAGARWAHLGALSLAIAPVMAWAAMSESYRFRRLQTFLDPWADPFNNGFQLTQALIAIGRGEVFGVGLGASVQKLYYLPEAHTDFIFSVIAEELGLVGVVTVLVLFGLLVGRGFKVATMALARGEQFGGWLAMGICSMLAYQTLISVGVNLGVLPTKGLTMPLLSSGGSSVLMTCLALALVLRVAHENAVAAGPKRSGA